jgi:hypothetical protein
MNEPSGPSVRENPHAYERGAESFKNFVTQ